MRRTAFLLILVSLATLSCQRSESTVAVAPSPGAGARQPPEAYPTKDEVLDYLDGKTISLSAPAAPAKGEAQFVLKRDKIEALEVSDSGTKVGDGPWITGVSFLAKTDEGRYAVKLTVQHRLVEGKRAFFGFRVAEMAKQ